ncbi:MAG: extracellular solute-binding protein [Clostridia bacterium]|nr:extracellular solute-binding protein [Clostridia bacterium]
MNKTFKKIVIAASALALTAGLAACDSGEKTVDNSNTNKLTYWVDLNSNAAQTVSNLGETPFAKKLMETIGVEIEYQHPAQGQGQEKFNIMVAMGNLPDIIEYTWESGYQGGAAKALADGVIKELDLEKDAPNLKAYIESRPEIDKMVKTDDGKYWGYPFIRGEEFLQVSAGLIVRQDWLDDLGLSQPETIDDWTTMLRAFKEKKGARAPLSAQIGQISGWSTFAAAYGIVDGLYLDGETVKYGPLEDSYKDYLATLNSWYAEGLLDPDYASIDGATVQANILNGVSGAATGSCGSGIGKWMAAKPDDKYNLAGVKYPVLNRGDRPYYGQYQFPVTGRFAVISRDCKNTELAAKLLDYGYSEEGQMLFNFGIEGESYNIVDDYPTYTENITANAEGLSMSAALAQYCMSHHEAPFVQDRRYMEQYASLPQQQEALTNWVETDAKLHAFPTVTLTDAQRDELATLIENLTTYKDEMSAKFIMGIEPLDKFDDFRAELKNRGVEKYLEYNQEAYTRYLNR